MKYKIAHMNAAHMYANLSHCERKKVGCTLVKDHMVFYGYNGTPANHDNCCEDDNDNTKPNVIHAELNAMDKMLQYFGTCEGAMMFVTMSPCPMCAERIVENKILYVAYSEEYRLPDGIEYLKNNGVVVEHL